MFNLNKNVYRVLLPNLLEILRVSFCWFLEKGLQQEFDKRFREILNEFQKKTIQIVETNDRLQNELYNMQKLAESVRFLSKIFIECRPVFTRVHNIN